MRKPLFSILVPLVLFPLALSAQEYAEVVSRNNQWLEVKVDTRRQGAIRQLLRGGDVVISPAGQDNGSYLQLYRTHPSESDETIALPDLNRLRQLRYSDDAIPTLEWIGEASSEFQFKRLYQLTNDEAILRVTTTITNHTDKEQVFYPVESVSFLLNPAQEDGEKTADYYLYAPYTPLSDEKAGVSITEGGVDNPQFQMIPQENVLLVHYGAQDAKAEYTSSENWLALYNDVGYRYASVEFDGLAQKAEPVTNNRSITVRKDSSTVLARMVLGKVTLGPGESLTYTSVWGSGATVAPVIDVKNGVAYCKKLIALKHSLGMAVYSALGLPFERPYAVEIFDKDGALIHRNDRLSIAWNPIKETPMSISSTEVPSLVSGLIGVDVLDREKRNGLTEAEWIHKNAHTVRLVSIDQKTKETVLVLDEATAPFEEGQFSPTEN